MAAHRDAHSKSLPHLVGLTKVKSAWCRRDTMPREPNVRSGEGPAFAAALGHGDVQVARTGMGMSATISRRDLFRRPVARAPEQRPPWALPEGQFTANCTRCGSCIEACPTGVLIEGAARFPTIQFKAAACTFCAACCEACPAECFVETRAEPWPIRAAIGDACIETSGVTCRMCDDACEHGAIRFRPTRGGGSAVTVSHERCTGCGACVGTCPVSAISIRQPQSNEVHS